MNIYEDEMLEEKLDEISNQMEHLVMDILLMSLKRLGNQNRAFNVSGSLKCPNRSGLKMLR
jgi:hypothetical protein